MRLDQPESAIAHYEQALDTIEALRAGLTEKEQKLSFMQDKLFVYDDLIDLLQDLHQKYPDNGYDRKALEIFERKQGRVFLEEMGQSGARLFAGLPESISQREHDLETQLEQTRTQLVDERAKPITDQKKDQINTLEERKKTLKAEQAALQEQIKTDYPDYYALKYPTPVALEELQQTVLQPGELLLVYGVMQDKTCLWLIGQDEFGLYVLDSSEDALAHQVAALREALHDEWGTERGLVFDGQAETKPESRRKLPSFAQLSHELYTLLFPEAVRPVLTSQHALTIVPTGPLYALPFELLLTSPATTMQEAQYLVEERRINYLSSASLLKTLREAQARRSTTARYPLLAFAHPTYSSETPQESNSVRALRSQSYRNFFGGEFVELPETADEARAIAQVLNAPHDSDPLQLREKASRANVFAFNTRERLDDYHYLIFAMHGVLPGEVSQVTQSALVLSDDFLTMANVFGLHLNAKLVSLSACNTGRGTQVKGEGVMGLTRAFMYAGTPTVAVTLWSVESLSAKVLDIGFFRHLNAGLSPAQALQAIKVRMLRGEAGDTYRHPYYWAPFVIFGDGL